MSHRVVNGVVEVFISDGVTNNIYILDENFVVQRTVPISYANAT